jgi:2-methylcitrate dehydratase PrpD
VVDGDAVLGEFLMAYFVDQLAQFAVSVDADDIPSTVRDRVRLQMLHIAALIDDAPEEGPWVGLKKMAPRRGAAKLKRGASTSSVAAAGIHAAMAASTDRLDHLLGGSPGVGAVCAGMAAAKGQNLSALVSAIAVGNEVGGRLGAALLLGPHHGGCAGWVPRVAAAATAGRLMGLSVDQMAHALGMAVVGGGPFPRAVLAGEGRAQAFGSAVSAGVGDAKAAASGVTGQVDVLEAAGGLLEGACWIPLPHAFSGLGEAWLTHTLSFPRWPGPPAFHAALDAVQEILDRHIKAADKRLRADQVAGIKIGLPAPAVALDRWISRRGVHGAAGLGHSLRHAVGALVVDHEFNTRTLSRDDWGARRDRYGDIARLVEVEHDLDLSLDLAGATIGIVAPLFGGITEGEIRDTLGRLSAPEIGWPSLGLSDLKALVTHRPDRWLRTIRYASHDLSDAKLEDWQLRLGASVAISTTRGGNWPDRRATAVGGPSSPFNDLMERVVSAFAGDRPERRAHVRMLWESAPDQEASPHVERLLA